MLPTSGFWVPRVCVVFRFLTVVSRNYMIKNENVYQLLQLWSVLRLAFCFQGLDENCSSSVAKVTDHIAGQKDTEAEALKALLDRMRNDKNVLLKQKEILLEETEDGSTRINGFLREELKVDVPTGIWRETMSHGEIQKCVEFSSFSVPKDGCFRCCLNLLFS